jgi:peptidyl-prolyl cis-trans isomerase SurA
MMKLVSFCVGAFALAVSLATAGAVAQTAEAPQNPQLDIPKNVQFFGDDNTAVRKATAIVNGDVITGTDVDQRVALIIFANGGKISPEELPRLRAQVLRNLVDETLEVQAAAANDIKLDQREIDTYYARYATGFKHTPEEFSAFLRAQGSSDRSVKRQIQGEIAWSRLQGREIAPYVNVSDDEVKAVVARLNAAKGTQEFHVGEIFLSATPETAAETQANAMKIVQQIRQGASFVAYARQFSEASTAAVGGDLGWVRAEQLPDALAQAVRSLPSGTISDPIAVPGGFSIIGVQDSRQVLTADPRDALLSLKQMTITLPPTMTRAEAAPKVSEFARVAQTMGGCGRAEEAAKTIGAEVVANDQVKVRDIPDPKLQDMLLKLSVGQATVPFGVFEEHVFRVLVLCGRDDPQAASGPSFDQISQQLTDERINMRSRRYLRDLRRDAVIDYR